MDETCKEVASSVCDEAVLEPGQDFASAVGTDMTPEEEFLSSILSGQDLSDLVDPEEERRKHEEYLESLTPGERETYFERQALEAVFADIRSRSRAGELTTEEYWEAAGLTPEHMEPVEFTDLVFDTIIEAHDICCRSNRPGSQSPVRPERCGEIAAGSARRPEDGT